VNSKNSCAECCNLPDIALLFKVSSSNVATLPLSINKEHRTPAADSIATISFSSPSSIVFG